MQEQEPLDRQATALLRRTTAGDLEGRATLSALVYDEVRAIAYRFFAREQRANTIQPTDVVHETFVRLIGDERLDFRDRTQFLAIATTVVRRVLTDHARDRSRLKRGGGRERVSMTGVEPETKGGISFDTLAIHDSLERLGRCEPRAAKVVELRYYGGLGLAEIAAALSVPLEAVEDDWEFARAWLLRDLNEIDPEA